MIIKKNLNSIASQSLLKNTKTQPADEQKKIEASAQETNMKSSKGTFTCRCSSEAKAIQKAREKEDSGCIVNYPIKKISDCAFEFTYYDPKSDSASANSACSNSKDMALKLNKDTNKLINQASDLALNYRKTGLNINMKGISAQSNQINSKLDRFM